MGGEKQKLQSTRITLIGSPPRGRGKDGNEVQLIAAEGITPAWAGKSFFCVRCAALSTDHPRMGGEKGGAWWIIILFLGSPPHGRGKGLFSLI